MSIDLKLQSSLLIWKLTKWDFPPLLLSFLLREFHLFTWPSPQGKGATQRCLLPALQMVQDALVSVLWLQRALIKVTQGILKWGTCAAPKGLLLPPFLTHTTAASPAQQLSWRCSSVNLTCSRDTSLSSSSQSWKSSFEKTSRKVQSFSHQLLLQREEV